MNSVTTCKCIYFVNVFWAFKYQERKKKVVIVGFGQPWGGEREVGGILPAEDAGNLVASPFFTVAVDCVAFPSSGQETKWRKGKMGQRCDSSQWQDRLVQIGVWPDNSTTENMA